MSKFGFHTTPRALLSVAGWQCIQAYAPNPPRIVAYFRHIHSTLWLLDVCNIILFSLPGFSLTQLTQPSCDTSLAWPSQPALSDAGIAVPFARVDTVKNELFSKILREVSELLRENNQPEPFRDSFCTFRNKFKAYATSRLTTRTHQSTVLTSDQVGRLARLMFFFSLALCSVCPFHVVIMWMSVYLMIYLCDFTR